MKLKGIYDEIEESRKGSEPVSLGVLPVAFCDWGEEGNNIVLCD